MQRLLLLMTVLLATVGGPSACVAQLSMTLQVPPGGLLLKKQLWAMALVYTGNNPIYTKISVSVSAASGDQPLLTGVTPLFLLNKGVKQIQAGDVSPIQYQYLSSAITDRDPDGFLPVGVYQACYTVQSGDEQTTPLAEDCITFEVEPLSPPELNTPADEDTLVTTLPQFTWLPPAPSNLFNNLSYRFSLVEVRPGQTPNDALEQNLPVYTNQNWPGIYINYPASALPLDTGRQYAWQVVAQNNLLPSAQSEIWTFRIKGSSPRTSFNGSYILLKNGGEKSGVYNVAEGAETIAIRYYSFDKAHPSNIRFLGPDQKLVAEQAWNIAYGDNNIIYTPGGAFQKGKLYFIEITDLHNNKFTAAFRIK